MNNQYTFSILGPERQEAFYGLRSEALTTSAHSYGTTLKLHLATPADHIRRMLEESQSDKDGFILGAFKEQQLVGMIGLRRENKENIRHKASIWGLYVTQPERQKGVGKSLVEEALAISEHYQGLHHIRLIVTDTDQVALKLFKDEGFRVYGEEKKGIYCHGRYYDQLYLARVNPKEQEEF